MQISVDYTLGELLATVVARQTEDGERINIGANLPVIRAGVFLAHLTHAPNLKLRLARTRTNLSQEGELGYFEFFTDWQATRWAESYLTDPFAAPRLVCNVFYMGAIQVDPYGNSNLIGVGADYRQLDFRGPGAVATCSIAACVEKYFIYCTAHTRRLFVERCDFISGFGYGRGGRDERQRLGLPGGGPRLCLTPLCLLDFDAETRRLRLKSVHPGVTVEQVVENTGFPLVLPRVVPETPPPTPEELHILRTRIDRRGELRQG